MSTEASRRAVRLADAVASFTPDVAALVHLEGASRLSPIGLARAIEVAHARITHTSLEAAARHVTRPAAGRIGVVLPSNVETSALFPVLWGLLAGNTLRCKLPSEGWGYAHALIEHLAATDLPIEARRFGRDERTAWEAFVRGLDGLHAYGDDASIEAIRRSTCVPVTAHGAGLGVAVVAAEDVATAPYDALARGLVLHDQRGCLSPQVLFVVDGDEGHARHAAHALHCVLEGEDLACPLGRIAASEQTNARRWRDVALAVGSLYGSDAHAVSVELGAVRDCPLLRHLAVHPITSASLRAWLARLGGSVKALALHGRVEGFDRGIPWGAIQRPHFADDVDGRPAHEGWTR